VQAELAVEFDSGRDVPLYDGKLAMMPLRPDTEHLQNSLPLAPKPTAILPSIGTAVLSNRSTVIDEVKGMMHKHCGEVRVWQEEAENWVALPAHCLAKESGPTLSFITAREYGSQQQQCMVGRTDHERCHAVDLVDVDDRAPDSNAGAPCDPIFGDWASCDCTPNFEKALSTLVVEGVSEHGNCLCLRLVKGITLPELFAYYGSHRSFGELYRVWTSRPLIIKPTGRPAIMAPVWNSYYFIFRDIICFVFGCAHPL
jgi:hypothetical protein